MQDAEIIQEFLVESAENLARLDQEILELEQRPDDGELLRSIFRTIHTIKGTCSFLGFIRLEAVAHVTETILNDLRNGQRRLDAALISLILEAVDAIRRFLASIEKEEDEGELFEEALLKRLQSAATPKPDGDPGEPHRHAPDAEPLHIETGIDKVAEAREAVEVANSPRELAASESTVRVDLGLLDRLMNQVGELVLTRNQVLQYNAARDDSSLNAISQRLNLITSELQEAVMKTRMQPIGVVWNKLPRLVRDLSVSLQKQVGVKMVGAQTELDRAVIEAIKDPLTHVVRNSCDHGIETPEERERAGKRPCGTLMLRAFHEGGQVNIEIEDDGAGIDLDRVRAKAVERGLISAEQALKLNDREASELVFAPGFSTAKSVTNVSGRGVGMDVLRTNIERINGTVDLSTVRGHGTTVRIRIPLTLAIIPGLLVSAGGERFVIPQLNLQELIRLEGDDIAARMEQINGTAVLRHRSRLLPLTNLSETLQIEPQPKPDEVSIVVVRVEGHSFGLIVDTINDTQEIVVKPLGQHLKGLHCFAGATIMGDGKVALILDVAGVGRRARVLSAPGRGPATQEAAKKSNDWRRSLLLFRAGEYTRLAITLSEVARLEKIPRSQFERAGGRDVIQYRGNVLPLVDLGAMFCGLSIDDRDVLDVVVVHGLSGQTLGLVVDEIIDIVDDTVKNLAPSDRDGLLGSAVVGERMTDFLDLMAVAARLQVIDAAGSVARLEAVLAGYSPLELVTE